MAPQRTLTESMQDLSLEDPKLAQDASQRARQSPAATRGYRWPKLPAGWHEQDRYFVLGWSIEHPRLKEFVKLNTPGELVDVPYMIRAPDFLELASGWRHIQVCTVLPQDVSLPAPWTDPNGPRETVIALAFTASRRLYERKPTREQYVWLLGLFGCYPQWYRDAVPKEHFDIHCITP